MIPLFSNVGYHMMSDGGFHDVSGHMLMHMLRHEHILMNMVGIVNHMVVVNMEYDCMVFGCMVNHMNGFHMMMKHMHLHWHKH